MGMAVSEAYRFQILLTNISRLAEKEHIQTLKFLLKDKVTRKHLDKCNTLMDIFERMMNATLLSEERLEDFEKLMDAVFVGKSEIAKLFREYNRPSSEVCHRGVDRSPRSYGSGSSISSTPTENFNGSDGLKHRTVDSQQQINLPERFGKAFSLASAKIGSDWKIFGRLGGLSNSELETIENKNKLDVQKQAFCSFQTWFNNQKKPSLTEFRKLLRKIPRNDVADDLKEQMGSASQQI